MPPTVQLVGTPPPDDAVIAVGVWGSEHGQRNGAARAVAAAAAPIPSGPEEPEPLDLDALAALGFKGEVGQTAAVARNGGPAIVAVGLGAPSKLTADTLRRAAAAAIRAAWRAPTLALAALDAVPAGLTPQAYGQALAEGALLAGYRFNTYKSDPDACRIERVDVVGRGARVAAGLERGTIVAGAVALARDLINEPAGALTPTRLAQVAQQVAKDAGLECEVLDEKAIERERLGGLRGVSLGSSQPPRLIRLTYEPSRARSTVALVGKGITFDSGGLSIKTSQGMMWMKADMSGAAAVLAVMSVLPKLAPPVRVIGFMPTTENLPGGRAIKPGDVLRIRNGKTVEVLNTDAEGRLVLADALSLAVEAGVDAIVDLATLTGACVVALGNRVAGLMGNDDTLIGEVRSAAERAGEPAWPLPLPEEYRKDIDSSVADVKNIGDASAGALVAGLFLKEFVGEVPWAHLDIAGPAWTDKEDAYITKGGTGTGVRTVLELLSSGALPRPKRSRART